MRNPIIEFIDVDKSFGDTVIYRNLHLSIYPGETLCIIGGSGTGKSVLIKMLVGLLKPDKGQVLAWGEDVAQMDEAALQKIRRRVAMLFQNGALFETFVKNAA